MDMVNSIYITILHLLIVVTSPTRQSFIDHSFFLKESCHIQFSNDITWYDAGTNLLHSSNQISKLENCQTSTKLSVEEETRIIGKISSDQILICKSSDLFYTDSSLTHLSPIKQNNQFYNCRALCSSNDFMKSVWISDSLHTFSNDNGMAKLSKYIPQLGSFVQTSKFRASRNQNAINLIFKHGDFVYTIYTGETGEARVARVCENDQGNDGSFMTDRYGGLSCNHLGLEHTTLLDVQFDSEGSQVFLLTSRSPLELSGRVLCAIPLQEIDTKLDTGSFLDYDESGLEKGTSGRKLECGEEHQLNYLTLLLDPISSSTILLSQQGTYNSFVNADDTWYFTTENEELDIMKKRNDGTLARIQTVQTNTSPSKLFLSHAGDVSLLSSHKIFFLPKFFCSHFQEPVQCYHGPSCFWSDEDWSCSLASEKRTLAEDYPEGVIRTVSKIGGCLTEITTYTEHATVTVKNTVTCPLPTLPPNVELVTSNSSCLSHVTLQCSAGSDLTSGDLVRQCLPSGTWSGSPPVCSERHCPTLIPSPGSYLSTDSTAVGTTLTTSCTDPCHVTSHQNSLHCQATGRWNGSLPTCGVATCYPLPLPKNTVLVYDQRRPSCGGQFVTKCAEGTDLVYGDLTRTCQSDGSWSGQVPLCTVTQCPVLPEPKNGYLSSSSRKVGSIVTATCNACHKVAGVPGLSLAVTAQCLSSGRWSVRPPSCEKVTCPPLFSTSGVTMLSLNTSCIGVAEFECSTGFTLLSGSLVRYCQPDGKWSGTDPVCVLETCPSLQFSKEEKVIVLRRGERYGEKSVMGCAAGSSLHSGQLELHCLPGGVWSGSRPRCLDDQSLYPSVDSSSEAPEAIFSGEDDTSDMMKIVAVVGWSFFAICLVFIILVFVLLRRGRLNGLCLAGYNTKSGLERQVTTSTTLGVGTLDIRKSRSLDPESVTPTYPPSNHVVTPLTPTYRIYDTVVLTQPPQENTENGVT
ncbi:hypothetical protein ACHWQZ_G000568 [Mnemiopsis leidyi]